MLRWSAFSRSLNFANLKQNFKSSFLSLIDVRRLSAGEADHSEFVLHLYESKETDL